MAHELEQLNDGTFSVLRAEDSEAHWHRLETIVPTNAPFDTAQFGAGAALKQVAWEKAVSVIEGVRWMKDVTEGTPC